MHGQARTPLRACCELSWWCWLVLLWVTVVLLLRWCWCLVPTACCGAVGVPSKRLTFNVSSAKGAAWELVLVDVVLALVALGCWSCLVVLTDVVLVLLLSVLC